MGQIQLRDIDIIANGTVKSIQGGGRRIQNVANPTAKQDASTKYYVDTIADGKVAKEAGKRLSSNDYTDDEKNKLAEYPSDIGSDKQILKNVGGSLQFADESGGGSVTVVDNLDSTSSTDALSANQGHELDQNKVEKEAGKGLSSNDYTTAEKAKLEGIQDGAEVNVKPDWNATHGDPGEILNKPKIPAKETAATIKTKYESNADTNAFTDLEQTKLSEYPEKSSGKEGQVIKKVGETIIFSDESGAGGGLTKDDIAHDLTTDDPTKVLGAEQGVVINNGISALAHLLDNSLMMVFSKATNTLYETSNTEYWWKVDGVLKGITSLKSAGRLVYSIGGEIPPKIVYSKTGGRTFSSTHLPISGNYKLVDVTHNDSGYYLLIKRESDNRCVIYQSRTGYNSFTIYYEFDKSFLDMRCILATQKDNLVITGGRVAPSGAALIFINKMYAPIVPVVEGGIILTLSVDENYKEKKTNIHFMAGGTNGILWRSEDGVRWASVDGIVGSNTVTSIAQWHDHWIFGTNVGQICWFSKLTGDYGSYPISGSPNITKVIGYLSWGVYCFTDNGIYFTDNLEGRIWIKYENVEIPYLIDVTSAYLTQISTVYRSPEHISHKLIEKEVDKIPHRLQAITHLPPISEYSTLLVNDELVDTYDDNKLILFNNATYDSAALNGLGGLLFNGVDQYALSDGNVPISGHSTRTVTFYAQLNSFECTLVCFGVDLEQKLFRLHVSNSGELLFNGSFSDVATGYNIDNNIHHHAIVYTCPNLKWYVDKILIFDSNLGIELNTEQSIITIAKNPIHNNGFLHGSIGYIKLFDYELNQTEINDECDHQGNTINEVANRNEFTDSEQTKLAGIEEGAQVNPVISTDINGTDTAKVASEYSANQILIEAQNLDKATNTRIDNRNEFTDSEQTKLAGIEEGAQVNPVISTDINGTDTAKVASEYSANKVLAEAKNLDQATNIRIDNLPADEGFLTEGSVVDNLTSTLINKPLSANQGNEIDVRLQILEAGRRGVSGPLSSTYGGVAYFKDTAGGVIRDNQYIRVAGDSLNAGLYPFDKPSTHNYFPIRLRGILDCRYHEVVPDMGKNGVGGVAITSTIVKKHFWGFFCEEDGDVDRRHLKISKFNFNGTYYDRSDYYWFEDYNVNDRCFTVNSALSCGIKWDNGGTNIATIKYDGKNLVHSRPFAQKSDKKLKKDIKLLGISEHLEKINQLDPVTFKWKDTEKQDMGLIAQDIEKIYPELVSTSKKDIKSLNYTGLISPLIAAVKSLTDQVKTLQEQVLRLEQETL